VIEKRGRLDRVSYVASRGEDLPPHEAVLALPLLGGEGRGENSPKAASALGTPEPALDRSADSLVRESIDLGSRGQGCPRSERRFV